MKTSDFTYHLPDELIARYPMDKRSDSRLLVFDGKNHHRHFADVIEYVNPGDVLVVNNTRVIAARLFGLKETGGKLELLIERIESEYIAIAHVKTSRSPKPGSLIQFVAKSGADQVTDFSATMLEREGALFRLEFNEPVLEVLEGIGHMPLPPYIDRDDELSDQSRYQTVYAQNSGAVAAPTAGLHFDDELLAKIKAKGVELAEVTLHVGAGTFQPVKVDDVNEHKMHSEWIDVPEAVCEKIKTAKAKGGRVIAVGTTTVRCLETAALSGELTSYQGETDIFIYPGFECKVVDLLVTNFHLPESTLLMLVSAFSGTEAIKQLYQEAVAEQYRFFSYGDAMLLFNKHLIEST